MSSYQQSRAGSPGGSALGENKFDDAEQAFDPKAYISSEFVNPEAIEGVKASLIETRDKGHIGGCSVDDFSPTTGVNWLNAMAEHYDCEVSGPYLGDVDHGGDYYLFHHRPKPPIPQGDLFEPSRDAG
ncbi:hypothetical protein [Bosea sp. Root670]|uniref:hypothetical protein n=1 Tax=Bosea sp. Root670 TaxID=1736583 RepID=UPI00138F2657|nr:hypothetical protein [Bosea sp. Root670]